MLGILLLIKGIVNLLRSYMRQTSKLISIDNNTGEIVCYSSKGALADTLHIYYDTVVSWFRDGVKTVQAGNYTIYKVDKYIIKSYPPRK